MRRMGRRMSDEETRQRMFNAARSLSLTGYTLNLQATNFEALIQSAAVSRNAAFRLWQNREAFWEEFTIVHFSDWEGSDQFDDRVRMALYEVINRHQQHFASEEGCRLLFKEAAHDGFQQTFASLAESIQWQKYLDLQAVIRLLPEDSLRAVLQEKLLLTEANFQSASPSYTHVLSSYWASMRLSP